MQEFRLVIDDFLDQDIQLYSLGSGDKHVLITAGLHGGEATGIYAARKVLGELEALEDQLNGRVTVSPVSNVTAFRRMTRTSPYDELDLNRIFPGNSAGSPSQRTAAFLWRQAQEADYIIDLHCCSPQCASYTLALHREHDFVHDFAAMFDMPVVIQSAGADGQLFVESNKLDKPAVVLELTGGGQVGEISVKEGDRAANAVMGVLRQLGIAPGEARRPEPRFCGPLERVSADQQGLYVPNCSPGDELHEGETLAKIDDEPVLAPFDGVAIRVRPCSYVFAGTGLMALAPYEG